MEISISSSESIINWPKTLRKAYGPMTNFSKYSLIIPNAISIEEKLFSKNHNMMKHLNPFRKQLR